VHEQMVSSTTVKKDWKSNRADIVPNYWAERAEWCFQYHAPLFANECKEADNRNDPYE